MKLDLFEKYYLQHFGWIVLISSPLFVCMVAFAATSSSRFGREPKNRPDISSWFRPWFLISSTLESNVRPEKFEPAPAVNYVWKEW